MKSTNSKHGAHLLTALTILSLLLLSVKSKFISSSYVFF